MYNRMRAHHRAGGTDQTHRIANYVMGNNSLCVERSRIAREARNRASQCCIRNTKGYSFHVMRSICLGLAI